MSNNNMNNKKFKKFMDSLSYYKPLMKPENRKYFDEISALYINRQIVKQSEVEKLLTKLTSRGQGPKSAIKLIENKYRKQESAKYVKKIESYFVTAAFEVRTMWYKNNNRNKKKVIKNNYLDNSVWINDKNANILTELYLNKYNSEVFNIYQDPIYYITGNSENIKYSNIVYGINGQHIENIEYSNTYQSENYYDLENIIKTDILKDYTIHDHYKRIDVLKFKNISIVKSDGTKSKDIKTMKMKSATPLKYPEFVGDIENEKNNDGFCVYDNFLTTYPHISEDEFIKLCSVIEPVKNKSDGITPEQLYYVCQQKDISHYAFDYTKQCFLKYVSKNRNYEALTYYCLNNHMYHIKDKEAALSLIRSAINVESKINSVFFDEDNNKEEKKKNIFDKLEIKENLPINEVLKLTESCIVIYNTNHINAQLIELMNNNIKPIIKKCKKTMITQMVVPISKKIKVYLFADQNDHSQGIDYKIVKNLCEKEKIPFNNQTFTTLICQIKDNKIKEKHERVSFSKEFRTEFFKKNQFCNNKECAVKLVKGQREIDHIIPLSHDGTNDVNNLQALCKECHYDKTSNDNSDEHINISQTHSSFSNSVAKVMESNLSKAWAFVEKVKKSSPQFYLSNNDITNDDESEDDGDLFERTQQIEKLTKSLKSSSIDINGCRRNILRFNTYDYPLFTVMDQFEKYTGQTKPGKYYVETNNYYMPLRGNGFYFYPTIKYCLENNIIQPSDIKYCIISSMVTPHDYFNNFIDYCVENVENSKLAINSMIGNFASTTKSEYSRSLMITEDLNEAFHYFYNNDKCFIDMKQSDRGVFYHLIETNQSIKSETERVIYDMIVEMEAIELHKLQRIIESKNGCVTEYKTDCIRFEYIKDFPFELIDDINLKDYYYPDGKPMYKVENKAELLEKHMKMANYMRTDKFEYTKPKFNIINDVEDNNFKPLIEKIMNLDGCSIEGIAGSGKSTLINMLVQEIKNKGLDCNLLTPTNISSILINGMTLDKFHKKLRSVDIIKNLVKDYIIVDEISMMKEIFYKMLTVIKSIKPETKIILVGHNMQFGPVCDRIGEFSTQYYFNSDVFHQLVCGNKLILTKCRRSDDRHYKNCSNVNNVNIYEYGNKLTNHNICYTNKKRIEINKYCMNLAREKNKKSKGIELFLPKNPFSKLSQDVYLHKNVEIMSIKNKKELNIVNGEMFRIREINKDDGFIIIDNSYKSDIKIPINKFQQLFHVAYCTTSHKSQGRTINQPYTIHDWHLMNETCRYVSLSRASDFDYVNFK